MNISSNVLNLVEELIKCVDDRICRKNIMNYILYIYSDYRTFLHTYIEKSGLKKTEYSSYHKDEQYNTTEISR